MSGLVGERAVSGRVAALLAVFLLTLLCSCLSQTTPNSTAAKGTTPTAVSKPATAAAPVAASPAATDAPAASSTLPTPTAGAVAGDANAILTTKAQANGPTIFVDGAGDEVIFKGIGWYGFNIGLTALGNLSAGPDAISNDFKQIVYRQRMLGFNSIRVAFSFDSTSGINAPPLDWTAACAVPSEAKILQTLVPGSAATTTVKKNSNTLPPLAPPDVPKGICNSDWPQTSTYQRFLWVVDYLISQGFYVMLDFHSNRYLDVLANGDESFYKQASWVASWVALVKSVLENIPAAHGRLLIDLINEPDGFSVTWEQQGRVASLGSYYINAIDALYPVCPGCLYLIEGGGQTTYCGINWGNGFMTDPTLTKPLDLSTPTDFFTTILSKPWLNQVVLGPHIYCPEVSGASDCFSGDTMYDALDKSFGYLTVAPGFCAGSKCRVFPVILDEFGSTFNNANETACMKSIMEYAAGTVNAKGHAPLTSWFFWSWQPDSAGTGGIVSDDWRTILWEKIGYLTGGTKNWATGFSLLPWYLSGFQDLTPVKTAFNSDSIAIAAKAPTPAEPPVIGVAASPISSAGTGGTTGQPRQTPAPTIPPGFVTSNRPITAAAGPTSIQSIAAFAGTTPVTSQSKSLSTGALAGIIVGAVVLLALIAALAILIIKLRNPRLTESYTPTSSSQSPLAPGAQSPTLPNA